MDLNELLKQHQIAVMDSAASHASGNEAKGRSHQHKADLIANYAQAIGNLRMPMPYGSPVGQASPVTITVQPATAIAEPHTPPEPA